MKNTPPSAQTEWQKFEKKYSISKNYHDSEQIIYMAFEAGIESERTCLLSLESMKMEPETYIEPCENCGGEGYGRAWTGHGRATGEAFGDRYEPTHSFVFCKECAPQFTIGKDWMGEEIWKRTSDRKENAQIRINSITRVSKEAKARNLLRQSILSEMEKGDDK